MKKGAYELELDSNQMFVEILKISSTRKKCVITNI